ncbi:hypothetical protein ND747_23220 [Frankia sp. R82]|nr:hypothetical protein [Frankia sp. R82]MCM3886523.1 hypothetical protein [Frankia sp. R82]
MARRSVAHFVGAYPGARMEPVSTCVDVDHPPHFAPVLADDWLAARTRRQRAAGTRPS